MDSCFHKFSMRLNDSLKDEEALSTGRDCGRPPAPSEIPAQAPEQVVPGTCGPEQTADFACVTLTVSGVAGRLQSCSECGSDSHGCAVPELPDAQLSAVVATGLCFFSEPFEE